MKEAELNQLLKKARKAADYQYRLGNEAIGKEIIQTSSRIGLLIIAQEGFNKGVQCTNCRKTSSKDSERDDIRENKVCKPCRELLYFVSQAIRERMRN